MGMLLKILDGEFCVCKVADLTGVSLAEKFCFIGKTDEEISVVTQTAPENCTTAKRAGAVLE